MGLGVQGLCKGLGFRVLQGIPQRPVGYVSMYTISHPYASVYIYIYRQRVLCVYILVCADS